MVEDSFDGDVIVQKMATKTAAQERNHVLRSALSSSMVDMVLSKDEVVEDSFNSGTTM